MGKQHFDVVIVGRSIGAFACACLLGRRAWRVLLLGDGGRDPSYTALGHTLQRRTFTLVSGASPAFQRVLLELAQAQTFKRRLRALDPMLQVMMPGQRLDLPPDPAHFARELEREFPDSLRLIDGLYEELAKTNAFCDAVFEKDLVLPPGTFWERREARAELSLLPHEGAKASALLASFPLDHAYRRVATVPATFATHLAGELPALALARLHGSWTRGMGALPGGEDELVAFFTERIRACGGDVRLGKRATRFVTKGSKVVAVEIDGDDEPTGLDFLVSDSPTRDLFRRTAPYVPSARTLAELPELLPEDGRFVVSVVVGPRGVPDLLASEAFVLGDEAELHVQRVAGPDDNTLLVAETWASPAETPYARARVLSALEREMPFMRAHYRIVDSPHDGLPLWDYRTGTRVAVDRMTLRAGGVEADPEPMVPRWYAPEASRGTAGLEGEPVRTPLGNAFSVGPTVLPALGQEGELLAAWSVARIITRTDRRREKMRREMWSKIEFR